MLTRFAAVILFLLPLHAYAQVGPGPVPYRGVNNWPLIFGPDNTYDIGAVGATRPRTGYFGTSLFTPALTVSGLTATRVPFAGSGGLITDDADLTFDGTRLSATSATVATQLVIPAGTSAATGTLLGNDTDTWIGSAAAGQISLYTNNTERGRLDASGFFTARAALAIGTMGSPEQVLSPNGTGVLYLASSTAGSSRRYLMGGSAAVASATALPAPVGSLYHITGTTTITSITSTNMGTGACITLIFDGVLTMTDGSNLKLAGDFVTSAGDTIGLCYDGTNWYETHRSNND